MTDDKTYAWLREEHCPFRMKVLEPGYRAREIIPAGGPLYDPQLGWIDQDGAIVFNDIGGQKERGWNPDEGYGAIWRLFPDDRLEAIVPVGNMGQAMPIGALPVPDWFGDLGGHIFFAGQATPGRAGAHMTHLIYDVAPGANRPRPFCVMPRVGRLNGGVSGAGMTHGFAPKGTPYEGLFFCSSMMNCTVYKVTPDGRIEPFLKLDGSETPFSIMPIASFWADERWGTYAGEMILMGPRDSHFLSPARAGMPVEFWHVRDGKVVPEPIRDFPVPPLGQVAPKAFGRFAGHRFWVNQGSVNLAHTTKLGDGPLPFDACLMRTDPEGHSHVFADQMQGGAISILFDGSRLVIATVRKSYSTGEYHEPDGTIYEIRWTG